MQSQDNLAIAANRLSRAAPAAWEEFVHALETYTQTVKEECISSPLETLPVAQGRAQQAKRLFETLMACRASADRIAAHQGK